LLSWAIGASLLSDAQAKKVALAAIRVTRDIRIPTGVAVRIRSTKLEKLVREYGIVALFRRNETVYLGSENRPYTILSLSRAKGLVVIAPLDDLPHLILPPTLP
jgi:hypothetical protein